MQVLFIMTTLLRRRAAVKREIRMPPFGLQGSLALPEGAEALVAFAHGSGSSRLSPRNVQVASALHDRGLGTLLFDLLTEQEASDRQRVFDIPLLANRLLVATDWLAQIRETAALPVGHFGASTGAAAALVAAVQAGRKVSAIVSRGGRPDLAGSALPKVRAPTLLAVGSLDSVVLDLNRAAFAELRCEKELAVVVGATHLFEEPGTLEELTAHACRWFTRHLIAKERP
jgi:pimeloyl-ACP methyl ester carboxylesterase